MSRRRGKGKDINRHKDCVSVSVQEEGIQRQFYS